MNVDSVSARIKSLCHRLLHRDQIETDLHEEIQSALTLLTEQKISEGIRPHEARRAAIIELGGIEQVKENVRAVRTGACLDSLLQDIRFGLRMLRKTPGFTAVAVLTLTLGIGGTTTMFSIVNSILLRPMAFRDSQQLFVIRETVQQLAQFYPTFPANLPNFRIWQKEAHSFDEIAIARNESMDFTGRGAALQISGAIASANIFQTLGIQPAVGRTFRPDEDQPGHDHVVILTDAFWRDQFARDPFIVGKSIVLNGASYEVIGVLPASLRFPRNDQLGSLTSFDPQLDFFKPLGLDPAQFDAIGEFDYAAIGRLKAGISPAQALAELNVIQAQITKQARTDAILTAELIPLNAQVVGSARQGLLLLLAAVGAVLLIVCVNLTNLLLARAPARMREAAIRNALGATKARLLRQMITESTLLAVFGGALGTALAVLGIRAVVHFAPPKIPRLDEVQMDSRVLLFAIAISFVTALLFALLPAWRIANHGPQEMLKTGSARSTEGARTRKLRSSLIVFEAALSTALLITAGLLVSSLMHVLDTNAGFATQHVLAADIQLPPQTYSTPLVRQTFYDRAAASMQALPGVASAGWISLLPFEGQNNVSGISIPGKHDDVHTPLVNFRVASPGYFKTMYIPLLAGRDFTPDDRQRRVVIVSQTLAEALWPGKNPVGQICNIEWGGSTPNEVIGVVGDVRAGGLDQPPQVLAYVPDQHGNGVPGATPGASIVIRSAMKPDSTVAAVRATIRKIDPDVPINALRPLTEIVSESVDTRRFQTSLAMLFAFCALVLAAIGVFGVVSRSVEERRHEIGIRLALGADGWNLQKMVLREGMTPVATGLLIGVIVSLAVGSGVRGLLYSVSPSDPVVCGLVAGILACVACLACYIPARRATRIDPASAMRCE